MTDATVTERMLAIMQSKFPREYAICLLTAQNQEVQATIHESMHARKGRQ